MSDPILIIAEAGVNHNGELERALQMIDCAAAAGADVVKFQTFDLGDLVTRDAPKADYQRSAAEETQQQMLGRLQLPRESYPRLLARCAEKGIEFLSTAFDQGSLHFLQDLGMKRCKVPSGEITNLPYLRAIGASGMPIILSTGMASLEEVQQSLQILIAAGAPAQDITVLHCTSAYPTSFANVNLRAMLTMRSELRMATGYSDHTPGIEIAVAAAALGAVVIEKHFTLDRTLPGPDQRASLEPDELEEMIRAIRNVEAALGSAIKEPTGPELEMRRVARRSLVAAVPIRKGERFSARNVAAKRPGTGVSPMDWDHIMGRRASRDYEVDDLLELDA